MGAASRQAGNGGATHHVSRDRGQSIGRGNVERHQEFAPCREGRSSAHEPQEHLVKGGGTPHDDETQNHGGHQQEQRKGERDSCSGVYYNAYQQQHHGGGKLLDSDVLIGYSFMSGIKNTTYKVSKLMGTANYGTWKQQMEFLLEDKDQWEAVSQDNPVRLSLAILAGIKAKKAKDDLEKHQEIHELDKESVTWDKASRKAGATISLYVDATQLKHINGCKTGREAWLRLLSIYDGRHEATK